MITQTLIDTSSWINFFSQRHKVQAELVKNLLEDGLAVINGLILSEILQGFRKDNERKEIEKSLKEIPTLTFSQSDYIAVGHLSASFRGKGQPTGIVDLLIAQSAISNHVPLLHYDSDYLRIAKATTLKCHPLSFK